jgi:archaemetzincin
MVFQKKVHFQMKKLLWIIPIVAVCDVAYYLLIYGNKEPVQVVDSSPHYTTTIYFQPLDNFTQHEAIQLRAVLEQRFRDIFNEDFEFEILPNKKLSMDLMNNNKSRYRADKIINSLSKKTIKHKITIGLTHKDISIPYKGKPDWGILGLARHQVNACVASTFRLKHKQRDYWKVVTHEFIHTYYRYPHCPKDSSHCIMKDAKGKADFGNKNDLCGYCKSRIG